MHNGERTVVAGGLIGGLLLGALLLRGGISAGKTDTVTSAVPTPATPLPPAALTDPEVESLEQRIAVLEKKQLARRLAELEAEADEPAEIDQSPSDRQSHPASPVRKPVMANVVPRHESALSSRDEPAPDIETRPRRTAAEKPTAEKSSVGPATLSYWNALNDVIARESAMRAPPANVTAANAGEFVQARLKAGRFASEAIGALDTSDVDSEALQLGRELIAWYREEVGLNERATSLLGSASVADRKGAAGNSWRSGEEQHRRKCDEINRHGAELRARLARKYGLAFPPLN